MAYCKAVRQAVVIRVICFKVLNAQLHRRITTSTKRGVSSNMRMRVCLGTLPEKNVETMAVIWQRLTPSQAQPLANMKSRSIRPG